MNTIGLVKHRPSAMGQWEYYSPEVQVQTRLAEMRTRLNGFKDAMRIWQAEPDSPRKRAVMEALRTEFRKLVNEMAELQGIASRAEQPAPLMLALDKFSDDVLALGKEAGEGIAQLPRALNISLPFIMVGLVLAAVALLRR